MNKLAVKMLNKTRWKIAGKEPGPSSYSSFYLQDGDSHEYDYKGEDSNNYIKSILSVNKPCMIARFGSVEFKAFLTYLNISSDSSHLNKSIRYMSGKGGWFWWDDSIKGSMANNAGFFPATDDSLYEFGVHTRKIIKDIDVLGSWMTDEKEVKKLFFSKSVRIPLMDLEPYYHQNPWSELLEGKTVLVIHPFTESIQRQYLKRNLLFRDCRLLPEFELKTLAPVQSIASNSVSFSSWFDALSWMQDKIANLTFDVAIIGAGAYGMPLAAFVKQIGRQAIHLGGATQILFGIRGSRWDVNPFFQTLFNEHWVYPLDSERPAGYQKVESGCYW